ncbi:hypothetical protein ACIP2X_26805 [Streptomyces sp. NPDC089424]|uniref:hypothetical protein n=1 Tax=Streptomyces sp. NPDC089424 TaxID=3365917 RepID=UPI003801DD10
MPEPAARLLHAHRGYHLFDIGRHGIDAQVRIVDTVLGPRATPSTLARLRVDAGRPGVRVV